MKLFHSITVAVCVMLCSACSSSDIEIEAEIGGLGTQNLHIVYSGDDGSTDDVVATDKDRFSAHLSSAELTVVTILDARHMPVAQFAAQNGDHIKIQGDLAAPHMMKITGNDATEQWLKFRHEHDELYTKGTPQALDREIEKWIAAHPAQPGSTLLLLLDHSNLVDVSRKQSLLADIAPEARPDHLITSVEWLNEYFSHSTMRQISSLNLCGTSGDFEVLPLTGRPALLYFWSNDGSNRTAIISAIKNMLNSSDESTRPTVADVLLDADTARWTTTCRADSAAWRHYWAPTGVMDIALRDLRIPAAPFFVTTDATGHILYRGDVVADAVKAMP